MIDWRDADYYSSAPLYSASYDFEVIFNHTNGSVTYQRTNGQTIYFSGATTEPSASIYEIAGKSQNSSSFKNLQMSTAGAGQNVSFTVGSTNYTVPPSGSIYASAGVGTVQITVPNQWVALPTIPVTYKYFWKWENGEHFTSTRNLSKSIDLSSIQASYIATMEATAVSGPTSFNKKMPLTYNANVYLGSPSLEYFWYIKYDFNNVWQYAGGLPSKTVVPAASPGYSFYIKCYVRDYIAGIEMWSNTMRVWYTGGGGCEECPVAYQGEGQFEPSPADSNADESVVYSGSWHPVNPDTLSAKQKFDLLWPIRETVWQLKHRFRWSNSDPSTAIDDSNETFIQLSNLMEQEELRKRKQAQEAKYLGSSEDEELSSESEQNQEGLSKSNQARIESEKPVLALHANYPNPFNPTTSIRFSLPSDGFVELSIYNIQGQLVRQLISGFQNAGQHEVIWNSRNNEGLNVASGIYLYRLKFGNQILTRKLTLVK